MMACFSERQLSACTQREPFKDALFHHIEQQCGCNLYYIYAEEKKSSRKAVILI